MCKTEDCENCDGCALFRFQISEDVSVCFGSVQADNMRHQLLGQKVFMGDFEKKEKPVDKCDHLDKFTPKS